MRNIDKPKSSHSYTKNPIVQLMIKADPMLALPNYDYGTRKEEYTLNKIAGRAKPKGKNIKHNLYDQEL